jgi:NADH:ubiquinone oxidoreductase subunit H
MISYEVSMGLILMGIIICVGDLNLTAIANAQKEI